jgi:N-acetylglutamate synthase-like GNAT family acetyltransferase
MTVNPFSTSQLRIVEYSQELAQHFYSINAEWIDGMFVMEAGDRFVLENPQTAIIDKGGTIIFCAAPDLGIIGVCALKPSAPGEFELTKMGVLASAQGRKAGEFLLNEAIKRARQMNLKRLYLLTNSICAPAIHLYEKSGFQHDAGIMKEFSSNYDRCDVAMLYPL